jgi:hypothetical protein
VCLDVSILGLKSTDDKPEFDAEPAAGSDPVAMEVELFRQLSA